MERRRGGMRLGALACMLALGLAAPRRGGAQGIEFVDPSARAGGMGGAGAAVGWNGAADDWLNPALTAASRGITIQAASQQLLPGIEPDLRFRATRFAVSYAGIAFASTGRPFGGESLVEPLHEVRIDPFGNLFFQYGWMESMSSKSAAVSAAGLADAVLGATGHRGTRLGRWGDVAWGRSWKRAESSLGFYASSYAARDEGWAVRVVPVDTRRGVTEPDGGARIELGFGRSTVNDLANPVTGLDGNIRRQERVGYAAHLTWWGPSRAGAPGAPWTDAFRGVLSPVLDVTLAYDHEGEVPLAPPSRRPEAGVLAGPYVVEHYGAEATLVRVLTGRFGYVDDRTGGIRKPSWGVGACLPLRRVGEIRYDFSSWPQAYELRVWRHELTLRLDPLLRLRSRGPGLED